MKQVKTFSDIDHCIDEIQYWIDRFDYDRMYSNRGQIISRAQELMVPCYVHLWMIIYPVKGMEYTRPNNISDLANWLYQITQRIKGRILLRHAFVDLLGDYLREVKVELVNHHGYSGLGGYTGIKATEIMSDVFDRISINLSDNRAKNKHYMIDRDTITEIINYVLEINNI